MSSDRENLVAYLAERDLYPALDTHAIGTAINRADVAEGSATEIGALVDSDARAVWVTRLGQPWEDHRPMVEAAAASGRLIGYVSRPPWASGARSIRLTRVEPATSERVDVALFEDGQVYEGTAIEAVRARKKAAQEAIERAVAAEVEARRPRHDYVYGGAAGSLQFRKRSAIEHMRHVRDLLVAGGIVRDLVCAVEVLDDDIADGIRRMYNLEERNLDEPHGDPDEDDPASKSFDYEDFNDLRREYDDPTWFGSDNEGELPEEIEESYGRHVTGDGPGWSGSYLQYEVADEEAIVAALVALGHTATRDDALIEYCIYG